MNFDDDDPRYWPRPEVKKFIPSWDAPYTVLERFKRADFHSSTGQVNNAGGYVKLTGSTGTLPPFYFTVGELRSYLTDADSPGKFTPRHKRRGSR